MITVIRMTDVIDEVLNAVKNKTKTTRVKARSVPVDKLICGAEGFFIVDYYSIPTITNHPLKVIYTENGNRTKYQSRYLLHILPFEQSLRL